MSRVGRLACLWAALGIALGAFGAHALKSRFDPYQISVWETAVRYQMYAAVGATWGGRGGVMLLAGSAVFSGTLYLLCFTGLRWLGAITPLGGLLMILGFVSLALEKR